MPRPVKQLTITRAQRRELRSSLSRASVGERQRRRARIILCRAEGLSQAQTAARLQVSRPVVILWERRFAQTGLAGLTEAIGRGRKPSIDAQVREKILRCAQQAPPN